MKTFRLLSLILILAAALAGCAPANPASTPTSTAASQPEAVVGSASASSGNLNTATQTPLGFAPTLAGGDTPTLITQQDNGKTLNLHVGNRFLLQLGSVYNWQIVVADQSVLRQVPNATVLGGQQGVFEAAAAGQTEFAAQGDPACRTAKPACAMPSLMFRLTVIVQ